MEEFGVELENYFKFNSSHFVAYEGFREPLHGHNYKVSIKIKASHLNSSGYVMDFGDITIIMKKICSNLNHCLLLPQHNKWLKITQDDKSATVVCQDESVFTFPNQDIKVLFIDLDY